MSNTDTILIALVAVIGALVLFQFVFLLLIFASMHKAVKWAQSYGAEIRDLITPVLRNTADVAQSTRQIMSRLEPKLDAAASNLTEMTREVREQLVKIDASVDDITERVRRQAARIDGMTSSTLNGVDRAGHFLNEAVRIPLRQASGIMAAAKAIVETLRTAAPARRAPSSRAADEPEVQPSVASPR